MVQIFFSFSKLPLLPGGADIDIQILLLRTTALSVVSMVDASHVIYVKRPQTHALLNRQLYMIFGA